MYVRTATIALFWKLPDDRKTQIRKLLITVLECHWFERKDITLRKGDLTK